MDSDATDSVTYSLLDDAGGRFVIDSVTGVVRTNAVLDAEFSGSHTIEVEALSSDGSTSSAFFVIDVIDVNESAVGPVTDVNGALNRVNEGLAPGALVGVTASAVDSDATDTVTYSLLDDAGGRFVINSVTGVVRTNAVLDAEFSGSHTIEVEALSSDGSTSSAFFVIDVIDVNESAVGPVTDANGALNRVNEGLAPGALVGVTASAVDSDATDTVTYSLLDDAGGRFVINSVTGVVRTNAVLDAEFSGSHTIEVEALSSDGSTSSAFFVIDVIDVNESAVGPVTDANGALNRVNEGLAPGALVGVTASAVDSDATDTVTYSLLDDAGGRFVINSVTGVVRTNAVLDAEFSGSHTIEVEALSSDGSTSSAFFVIDVIDVNESAVGPVTDANGALNQVDEGLAAGALVGVTASAVDSDATDTVTYSLLDDAGGRFVIDSVTGVVRTNAVLDAEFSGSHTIEVEALSSDGSTSSAFFVIDVIDVNESAVGPVTDVNGALNRVNEGLAPGALVGVTASAVDSDATDTVTYSLLDDAGGRFVINSVTGVVRTNAVLDAEFSGSHTIEVEALSSDGSTSSALFVIDVIDVNESAVGPVTDVNGALNRVNEGLAPGALVGVTASAVDSDATDTVTYSLLDDAGGRFVINSVTGVVRTNAVLDAEFSGSHTIEVEALSSDGSTSSAFFVIDVIDVNESSVGPVTDVNGALNRVSEGLAPGALVGITASAVDPDVTDAVTYSLINDAGGRFVIDAVTGVVTTTSSLDYETASSHTIRVAAVSSDGSTSARNFTINVVNIDDEAPTIDANQVFVILESAMGGDVVGTVQGRDVDSPSLGSWTLSGAAEFEINSATGEIRVAPGASFDFESQSRYDVSITASDGVRTASNTVTILIGNVNESPFVASVINPVSSFEDSSPISINLTGAFQDPDAGDALTWSVAGVSGGAMQSARIVGSRLVIDLAANASGTGQVRVVATDAGGLSAFQDVDVVVAAVNDQPTARGTTHSTIAGQTLVASVAPLVGDVDGDSLTTSVVTGPANGVLSMNTDGSFRYQPNDGFSGKDSFIYVVNDGQASSMARVTLDVMPALIAPSSPPGDATPPTDNPSDPTDTDATTDSSVTPSSEGTGGGDLIANSGGSGGGAVSNMTDQNDDLLGVGLMDESSTGIDFLPSNSINLADSTQQSFAAESFFVSWNDHSRSDFHRWESEASLPLDWDPVVAPSVDAYSYLAQPGEVWQSLDDFHESVTSQANLASIGSVTTVTSGFIVGYVFWALRSGVLLSSVMASLPAWNLFDPMVIVHAMDDSEDEESLESIVDQRQEQVEQLNTHDGESGEAG